MAPRIETYMFHTLIAMLPRVTLPQPDPSTTTADGDPLVRAFLDEMQLDMVRDEYKSSYEDRKVYGGYFEDGRPFFFVNDSEQKDAALQLIYQSIDSQPETPVLRFRGALSVAEDVLDLDIDEQFMFNDTLTLAQFFALYGPESAERYLLSIVADAAATGNSAGGIEPPASAPVSDIRRGKDGNATADAFESVVDTTKSEDRVTGNFDFDASVERMRENTERLHERLRAKEAAEVKFDSDDSIFSLAKLSGKIIFGSTFAAIGMGIGYGLARMR